MRSHRGQRELLRKLALRRSAEMRHHNDGCALCQGSLQGRQRGTNSSVARHQAVFERHVQVLADQQALLVQGKIIKGADVQSHGQSSSMPFAALSAGAVSSAQILPQQARQPL